MAEVLVPKGERTRVLYIWNSSMTGAVRFNAKTRSGRPPKGKVETSIRRLFKRRTTEYPLKAENHLAKGMFDSSYMVFVTPEEDTTITFQTRHFRAHHLVWALGIIVVLGIVSALIPMLMR